MHTPAPLTSELRVALEPFRLLGARKALRAAPRGSGPVVVLPGYKTTDRSTAPLRRFLKSRGYDAVGWGLGVNEGRIAEVLPPLIDLLESLGPPVALVGWSWGGVVARALARAAPEAVSQVITLGSPLQGGVGSTAFGRRVDEDARSVSRDAAARREAAPLPVPSLSVYTRRDAVVAWEASIDPVPGRSEHVEVDSCHLGLGMSPAVWLLLAERLAHP